jgi:DNA (cytosine-5)-methyltransferase 1
MKPRLLDLFCGAGGAAMGYHRAGFEVVGVDINPQSHYPFEFHQADAMTYPLEGFDVIHASPPCQKFTAMRTMHNAKPHDDLLTPTRERLKLSGLPWVIENVPGAPMNGTFMLCGTMFNLGIGDAELWRHRYFETSFPAATLTFACRHYFRGRVIGVYGGHGRDRRRIRPKTVGVYGSVGGSIKRDGTQQFSTSERAAAMGIDWMNGAELSQAIPPAYTEWIGRQLMEYLK